MKTKSFSKTAGILFSGALLLTRGLEKKAVSLAKIKAATHYLKGVQVVRRQCFYVAVHFFAWMVLAAALVAMPPLLIFLSPMEAATKFTATAIWAMFLVATPLIFLCSAFSEKRWMDFTKSSQIIEKALHEN